jgi:hypothetical protein
MSVSVPANKIAEFNLKAVDVFKVFKVCPHINIKEVRDKIEEFKKRCIIGDGYIVDPKDSGMKVIMSNVAYNYVQVLDYRITGHFKIYIEVPNGSAQFDLGRETLTRTDELDELLKSKYDVILTNILADVQKEVDSCKYENDARKIIYGNDLAKRFNDRIHFNGKPVNEYIHLKEELLVYSRRYDKKVSKRMEVCLYNKTAFYETKEKNTSIVMHAVRMNGGRAIILTKEMAEFLGINPADLLDSDLIPKPEKKPKKTGQPRSQTVKCYKIDENGCRDYEGEIPIGSIYCTIFRKEIPFFRDLRGVTKTLAQFCSAVEKIEVYVIRESIQESKWFKKLNCVGFDEFLRNKLKDHKETVITNRRYKTHTYQYLKGIIENEDVELLNHEENSYLLPFMSKGNIVSHDISEINERLEAKYPLLKILDLNKTHVDLFKKVLNDSVYQNQ